MVNAAMKTGLWTGMVKMLLFAAVLASDSDARDERV
jgi:hypothetical protein